MRHQPPDHWKSLNGPCGWFRIWLPPSWQVEVMEGVSHVMLPEQAGILSIRCVWGDVPRLDEAIDLNRLFPWRRKVQRIQSLVLSQTSAGWQGEAVLDPERSWWKRWFGKKQWHRWKAWAIEWPRMRLLVTFVERHHNQYRSDLPDRPH